MPELFRMPTMLGAEKFELVAVPASLEVQGEAVAREDRLAVLGVRVVHDGELRRCGESVVVDGRGEDVARRGDAIGREVERRATRCEEG
jgi:hypothetical protein